MHSGFPWVMVIGLIPLVGVLGVIALPREREGEAKVVALGASLLAFADFSLSTKVTVWVSPAAMRTCFSTLSAPSALALTTTSPGTTATGTPTRGDSSGLPFSSTRAPGGASANAMITLPTR